MLSRLSFIVYLLPIYFCGCGCSMDSPTPPVVAANPTHGHVEPLADPDNVGPADPVADPGPVQPVESVSDVMPPKATSNALQADDAEVRIITFDDLILGMEPDMRFRPFLLVDRPVQELLGKRVNVSGYINPGESLEGIKEFILLRNLECKFGKGGQADHLVHVLMQGDVAAKFTDQIVYVEGELVLNPFHSPDGSATWSIYDLKATSFSTTPSQRQR